MRRRHSLRLRLVAVGMAVVAAAVLALDVFVYLRTRDRLEDTLTVVLQSRLETASQLAIEFGVEGLGDRMADAGIPGVVARVDGTVEEAIPTARRFVELPPDIAMQLGDDVELATTVLGDGTLIEVAASRAGINRTLRTIVVLEGLGSLVAVLASGLLLHRTAGLVLRPIDRVIDVARSTADGRTGERLTAEDPASELGRMATAFNEMLDAQEDALATARAAEQRSRTFLAEAAHQLRTPVAGMRAAAEALALTDDDLERDELTDQIGHASARAGRLVARLLRLAELDEGAAVAQTLVDLAALALHEATGLRTVHGIDVRVTTAGDTTLYADELGLRDVVSNLFDNARRHGRPPVVATVTGTTDEVLLIVRDAGDGVNVEQRTHVFDRFVSLQGAGSGLGLAIVQSVLDAHGGTARFTADGVEVRVPRASVSDPRGR